MSSVAFLLAIICFCFLAGGNTTSWLLGAGLALTAFGLFLWSIGAPGWLWRQGPVR